MSLFSDTLTANGTTAAVIFKGNVFVGTVYVSGTFGGGTVKLQAKDENDVWHDVGTEVTFTDNGIGNFSLAGFPVLRFNLSGATSPSVFVQLDG